MVLESYYVYILKCRDESYYVGHTDDLDRRLAQHQSGAIPGYTRNRRPITLAWCAHFPGRDQAFQIERQIKDWSRAKKEALIAKDFDLISKLSKKSDWEGYRSRT